MGRAVVARVDRRPNCGRPSRQQFRPLNRSRSMIGLCSRVHHRQSILSVPFHSFARSTPLLRFRSSPAACSPSLVMTSRLDGQMIPTRFLMTMAHFIAIIMVFYTKHNNIANSLSIGHTQSEYNEATSSVLAALWLSIICLCIEFTGLLMGVSMFMVSLNGYGQTRQEREWRRCMACISVVWCIGGV
jgi:hypothetical protein